MIQSNFLPMAEWMFCNHKFNTYKDGKRCMKCCVLKKWIKEQEYFEKLAGKIYDWQI